MSYLYDSLRSALGGKNFKSGTVIKNWTPNNVKALYIMKDGILVVGHTQGSDLYELNFNEVQADVLNPNRKGNLNNLLENRQLSCMEEIYVSPAYKPYKGVIDLEEYVRNNYNSFSRLRYYGYADFDLYYVHRAYSANIFDGKFDFTSVKNIGVTGYVDVINTDWYKKYNLRPQYYALDSKGGMLHTYFAKCDSVLSKIENDRRDKEAKQSKYGVISALFDTDISRYNDIILLKRLITHLSNCDEFKVRLATALKEALCEKVEVKGFSQAILKGYLSETKRQIGTKEKYILSEYNRLAVYDKDNPNIDELDINDVSDGIIHLYKRVDKAISKVIEGTRKKEDMMLFLIAAKKSVIGVGGSTFRDLSSKNIKVGESNNLRGLLEFLYNLCGYSEEGFVAYLRRGNE